MPHIVIEYSKDSFEFKDLPSTHNKMGQSQRLPLNTPLSMPLSMPLSIPGLVDSVFEAVANTNIVKSENIKVRTYAAEFYKLGLNNTGFIHVVCKTHSGKTENEKKGLSQTIVNALERMVKSTAKHSMVITVEVVEMDTPSYSKTLVEK
ncbi:5-carboxymethyl-2-hydroxymuconate Delta-isomerase [Thiomicrorhabdus sp. Milos-T2]|uniref:5-carboxymethyl-2-hydroxymuconate Delta-isomerase n=1 Tax=Thiomicrorhabdus sp. Milos-T2 TaxID=90814 RepID=UPI000493C347|nr:hypothetical protein [Thiomicrorhabdus sp. Milos-T2]